MLRPDDIKRITTYEYMDKHKIIEILEKRKKLRTKELHKYSPHGSNLSRTRFVYAMSQLDLIDELLAKIGAINENKSNKRTRSEGQQERTPHGGG